MGQFLNCRDPVVRWLASRLGHALLVLRAVWQPLRRAWVLFGGSNFLMNAMASTVMICCVVLVWWAVVEDVSPIDDAIVVGTVPEDRIIDRDKSKRFGIIRRICMSRGAWGQVTRTFVSEGPAGLVFTMTRGPLLFFPKGCHERRREIDIPDSLPPGHYIYRVQVEFCNQLRCENAWVQDVPLTIQGSWPVQPMGGARPMGD